MVEEQQQLKNLLNRMKNRMGNHNKACIFVVVFFWGGGGGGGGSFSTNNRYKSKMVISARC